MTLTPTLLRSLAATVTATSHVTIHKIKILNDGDKHGRGELYF